MSHPPQGFGKGVNNYLNHYVNVADAKAGVTMGADLTIASLLLANQPHSGWPLCLNWASILIFVVSALSGGFVVFPRRPSGGDGLIFWEDIYTRKAVADYHKALEGLNSEQVEKAYATQNWYMSKVLHSKYFWIQWCIGLFLLGIVVAAISIGGA